MVRPLNGEVGRLIVPVPWWIDGNYSAVTAVFFMGMNPVLFLPDPSSDVCAFSIFRKKRTPRETEAYGFIAL